MGSGASIQKPEAWMGVVSELEALALQQRRVLEDAAAMAGDAGNHLWSPARSGARIPQAVPVQSPGQSPGDAGIEGGRAQRRSSILKSGEEVKKIDERRKASVGDPGGGDAAEHRRRGSSISFTGSHAADVVAATAAADAAAAQAEARASDAGRSPARPGHFEAPEPVNRRISGLPGDYVEVDGKLVPKAEAKRHNRKELMAMKKKRKDFFDTYMTPCQADSPMMCTYLGHIAAALSFLLFSKTGVETPKNRVTIEDIFFTCHLPLHYMTNSSLTLAEFYDVAKEFVDHDPRFRDQVRVEVCHMDPVLVDGEVEQGQANDSGDRGPPPLAIFRKSMEDDLATNHSTRIFNFDPFVVEQSKINLDDSDESDDYENEGLVKEMTTTVSSAPGAGTSDGEAPAPSHMVANDCVAVYKGAANAPQSKFGRKNRGWFSTLMDFNGVQGVVQLADCTLDTEVHMTPNDAPIGALYNACCSRDRFNGRMRGFVRFSLTGEGGGPSAPPLKEEEELDSRELFVPDLYLGKGSKGIPLNSVDPNISEHITAFAFAVHLLQGLVSEESGVGTSPRDICMHMDFPLQSMINFPMTIVQAFAYFQAYLSKSGLGEKMYAACVPIDRKVGNDDAPPTMSITEFENVLIQVMERSPDSTQPSCAMVLMFDVSAALNLLGLHAVGGTHYGILMSYDEENQMVSVLDVFPKKYTRIWVTSLTRLHKAMVGRGYVMVYKREPEEDLGEIKIGRQDTMIRKKLNSMALPPSVLEEYINSFEYPPQVMCVTILAVAYNKFGKHCMVRDIVHDLDCDPSFIVSDHISVRDLCRVANNHLNNSGWRSEFNAEVQNFGPKRDESPRVPLEVFAQMLKDNDKNSDTELIVQCSKSVLAEYGGGGGGEYCIVLAIDEPTQVVTVGDVNPQIYFRHTSLPLQRLWEGIRERDPVSMRARGTILLTRTSAGLSPSFRSDKGRDLNMLKIPSAHPFKLPQAVQLSLIAFALSMLGHPCSAEEVFYTAFTCLSGERFRRGSAIFPWQQLKISMHDLKERMNASAVAKMLTKFEEATRSGNRGEAILNMEPAQFRELVTASSKRGAQKLLLLVYHVEKLHDMNLTAAGLGAENHWQIGSGIVKDFDPDTQTVTVADANPTRYGDFWRCHIDTLHEAMDLSDPKQEDCGLIAIGKATGEKLGGGDKKGGEGNAEDVKFGPGLK